MNKFIRLLRACCQGLFCRAWPEGFCLGFLIRLGNKARAIVRRRAFSTLQVDFVNRSKGTKQAVIVLVGYKPELWPLTLGRIARFVPADFDVCLASSGRRVKDLENISEQHGWSYLSTNLNEVGIAQNLAIEGHPAAQYIFKLDEDIFIGQGFFDAMLKGHMAVTQEGRYKPGFSAPLINVSGYGYFEFLKELGIGEEYAAQFGEFRQSADKIRAHYDGEAALWIWKHSLPFDQVAERFANREFKYSVCPFRFSIGAILFERSLWIEMGGMAVSDRLGVLGWDEEQICKYCINSSQVMVVLHNVIAGHFGFGPQNKIMSEALADLIPGLEIKPEEAFQANNPQ